MTSFDPFAEFAAFAPKPAPPAPAPQEPKANVPIMQQPMMQQQPQQQQQQQGYSNPFGGYNASPQGMAQQAPMMQQQQQTHPGMTQGAQMVPAAQQGNQWAVQQQGMQQPPAYQQPVSPQQQMVAAPNQAPANGYMMSPDVQNPYMQQQQQQHQQQRMAPSPVPSQPVQTHTAPAAVVQEDDDFFGAFSNSVAEASPSRPPSVFEANEHDDVSYLSKSTGGGTERRRDAPSPLDDPKFAPRPPAVHGLANAQALSQHAPNGASPLPDFDLVSHSGYVLARISFRTILIKKWKQTFWIMYGSSQVLFFRSSADFEDWVSNPYLSQGQRDFLVKLKIDFVQDLNKQSVRGYQVTTQRLKNYNNKMLHQFKLERWMDYGPTIAAAYASPNEREVKNLRTVFMELKKRSPQNSQNPHDQAQQQNRGNPYQAAPANTGYGNAPANMHFANDGGGQQYNYSSSASTGRLEYGVHGGASVRSHHSQQSYGVQSSGPVEMSRDQYVAGYRVTTSRGGY